MSQEHAVRDRMAQRLVVAGHTPTEARQRATESLKRVERDKQRDTKRK
jgi:hypothetical protein